MFMRQSSRLSPAQQNEDMKFKNKSLFDANEKPEVRVVI